MAARRTKVRTPATGHRHCRRCGAFATVSKRLEDVAVALVVTVAAPVAQALINLNEGALAHPSQWASGLVVGCATAVGLRLYDWAKRRQSPTA